ncbi:MAG: asparagine synthase (glutamine-hydrolyzing) [Bacteroidia bacterium]|nr:asparagine synthase (glutamine-hydrolyzing) [Bacteroidia bacterium]
MWNNRIFFKYDYHPAEKIVGAFGFRRLSILDLSSKGHQPMSDTNGNYWIIYNGEIYNYIELRTELIQKGYIFTSNTDTEVIISSYKEWGIDCLSRFNGMWSFCIYDRANHELFCARDRLGIKPFYYFHDKNVFAFGSEIKQILCLTGHFGYNESLIFDFLVLGTYGNYNENTYFNHIKKLQPGHYLILKLSDNMPMKIKQYWNLSEIKQIVPQNPSSVYKEINSLFYDSVKLHLRSDVPVGTAFSGGLDSSGIVCMVDKIFDGDASKNMVFTVISDDKTIEDPKYVKIISKKIPITSNIINFSQKANLADLSKYIWHQEEPLQSASIFGSWYLYKLIKEKNIKVILDGQGADEFMGGYYRIPYKVYFNDLLGNGKLLKYFNEIRHISKLNNISKTSLFFSLLKGIIVELKEIFPVFYNYYKLKDVKKFFIKSFFTKTRKFSVLLNKSYRMSKLKYDSKMKKESFELSVFTNLPGILRQVDRDSMAFSIESRVPFLDYRLVELLYSLPYTYMFAEGYTKYAYRKAMQGIIPEEVLWRTKKEGFLMPEYQIIIDNINFVNKLFEENKNHTIINIKAIQKRLEMAKKDKKYYDNIIWRTITFLVWEKVFSDNHN